MTDTLMITNRSSVDHCIRVINESVREVMLDVAYEGMELSEDEVWCDLAASLLMDAKRDVAREVCRMELGFVPGQLIDHWRRYDRQVAARNRAQDRARQAAKTQARQAAAEQRLVAERQAIKDATCPRCFTVRTPAGTCNC